MKKGVFQFALIICSAILFLSILTLFTSCPIDPVGPPGGSSSSTASSTSSSGPVVPSDIMRVYSDRTEGTQLPLTLAWEIWEGSVALNPVTGDGNDGGDNATECVKGSKDWMGFTIKTENDSQDVSAYRFLVFSLKISADFSQQLQVGIGLTNAQDWYNITETRDGAWNTYVIDVISNTNLDILDWAFAMRTSGGAWTTGTVRFDDVYFTKTTNHLSNYSEGAPVTNESGGGLTFGIYTETVPEDVIWDTDAKMDVWNGFSMASETGTSGDGVKCLRVAGASSTWGGLGMRVEPLASRKDLSAFTGGYFQFMYRSDKRITKIGIKGGPNVADERWIFLNNLVNLYGMLTNDTWSTVKIPLSAFTNASGVALNLTNVEQYFMFVSDGANYAIGNVYYIDNIYFSTN